MYRYTVDGMTDPIRQELQEQQELSLPELLVMLEAAAVLPAEAKWPLAKRPLVWRPMRRWRVDVRRNFWSSGPSG